MKNTPQVALERFATALQWPLHLKLKYPDLKKDTTAALSDYFGWSKGNWGAADYLAQCAEAEMPVWLRQVCSELKAACEQPT